MHTSLMKAQNIQSFSSHMYTCTQISLLCITAYSIISREVYLVKAE